MIDFLLLCDSGLGEPRQPKIAEVRNYMLKRSSSALKPWVVVTVGALVLALCAFFTLPNFSPDPTFAQTPGPIEYAENSDVDDMPVRTFTSEDPEGAGINWDVTGIDADDFTISGGVLRFKKSPNFEKPSDRAHGALDRNRDGDTADTADGIDVPEMMASDNMYQITIRASEMDNNDEMALRLSTETHVTVQVTNVNEDGMVTIDLRQPEDGTPIMASVTDPDGIDGNATWQWSVSTVTNPVPTASNHWASAAGAGSASAIYEPDGDAGKYLRAVATYTDALNVERVAIGVSEFPVRAEVTTDNDNDPNPENGSPGFQQGADYTRTVSEDLGKGMNVGAPVMATDPNDDTLTYELDDDASRTTMVDMTGDVGYFSVDKTNGQLMVRKPLDWDMNGPPPDGKYEFYVRAIDPSGETAEVEVTVIATDANDAPKVMGSRTDAQQDAGDAIPAAPSEIRVLEQDSDGETYYGTPGGMMGTAGSAMGLPVALALGNQNVFTAPDEDERGQIFWDLMGDDADDFVLTQGGQEGTRGTLTGPDEPIALVFISPPDYENPTDADGDSVYKVVLQARDSGGLTDTRPITIFVDNVPEKGKATLMATGNGIDQPTIGSTITADVVDPDGGVAVLTWQWKKSKTERGDFKIIPSATAPGYTPAGADDGYYLRAIATYIDATSEMDDPDTGAIDERVQESATAAYTPTTGDGADADADKVFRVHVTSKYAVRVGPGDTPDQADLAFAMESYEFMLAENAEVGSIVGAPVRVTERASFDYDLNATETDDDNYFTIDPLTGQIRVGEIDFRLGRAGIIYPDSTDANATPAMEDPVLDFEGNNVFRLVVTATDSADDSRKARADVTIRLTDLNESPYFDKASREKVDVDYPESRVNRVVSLEATEPDGASLRWEVAGADAAAFEVRDVADIPGDGKDRRELHFKSQPNHEKKDEYSVIVRAVEMTAVGGGPNLAAELYLHVRVGNSDEPGKVEVKWLQPEVGTPLPAMLTDPDGSVSGTTWQWYRAKNSNPDLDPDITTLNDDASDWEQITGANSSTYTPQGKMAEPGGAPATGTAADEGWKLLVRANYTDGEGAGKSAIGVTYLPVRADVHDDRNNSPDFRQDSTARSVPEDTAVGANVGAAVRVDLNEDNDTLTYTLDNDKNPDTPLDEPAGADIVGDGGDDVSYFSIDKKTGQIRVAKPLDWDNNPAHPMDANGEYVVWVRATDPSGEMDEDEDNDYIKVTITATDVNDAPEVTDGLAEISIYEVDSSKMDSDASKFVGLGYELFDNDSNPATPDVQREIMTDSTVTPPVIAPNLYHRSDEDRVDRGIWPEPIAGSDGHLFEYSIPDNGIGRRLHFKRANLPDYENPMDHNRDNVYEVTVIVRDNGGATGMKKVRITVMNVNEAGALVLSPEQPHAGMPVTATLTDPDGVEIITDWKWAEITSRVNEFPGNLVKVYSTTDEHTGSVGTFVWAMVDYRDGHSVDDDPVTALDERNNDPGTDAVTEHHKFPLTDHDNDPATPMVRDDTAADTDALEHNSDRMMSTGTDNAVRTDPAGGTDPMMPSQEDIPVELMVYENVPSTGYVGIPLNYYDLRYPDGQGGHAFRDTVSGGLDGAFFEFAEDKDDRVADGYYDEMLVDGIEDGDDNDKHGQLAAAVVTHFDYEGDKTEYIIEVTDPDAEVSVGAVQVTIKVMDVNEAPSAPGELKGGIAISGPSARDYPEVTDAEATTWGTVAMYRAQGGESDSAVWTLNGADAGAFSITANGANGMADTTGANAELTFDAAPNYEMAMDADGDNVYEVTVMASDGTNRASRDIRVTVVNMEDPGMVTLTMETDEPRVDGMITAMVDDEDGGVTGTTWEWSRCDDAAGAACTSIANTNSASYTPVEADEDMYLQAVATYTDAYGDEMDMATGRTSEMVKSASIVGDYDANQNGRIDRDEAITAVLDALLPGRPNSITREEAIEVVTAFILQTEV